MKILPTLQVAVFMGSWVASWMSLLFNSYRMVLGPLGGHRLDVLYVFPVVVLLLGLLMTNLSGYLEEQKKDPALARAAIWDADMFVLIRRHGRELCAGKAPEAWSRLKTRQALGRGIPLSMVSFYLASRHLVEGPSCQAASSLSRVLVQGREQSDSRLVKLLADHRQICGFDLPFGQGLNCTTSEELKPKQTDLLRQLQEGELPAWGEGFTEALQTSEKLVWSAAHCEQSTWLLQAAQGNSRCGYETCVSQGPMPAGPIREVNRFFTSQVVPLMMENKNMEREIRRLASRSANNVLLKAGASVLPYPLFASLVAKKTYIGSHSIAGVLIIARRQWQLQFLVGLASLLTSVQPLATMVWTRRRLKPFRRLHLLLHCSLDILILEITAILILNASVIIHIGRGTKHAAHTLMDATSEVLKSFSSVSEAQGKDLYSQHTWPTVIEQAPKLVDQAAEALRVGPWSLVQFLVSALIVYSLSTHLLRASSVSSEFPLVSRWNAAVGGPLQLLGAVEDPEVRRLCQPVRWQILLRSLLLSGLLLALLCRASAWDVGLFTSMVFQVRMFRAHVVWLILLVLHLSTGMLVVMDIEEQQEARDQKRRLRDVEAPTSASAPPPYGTFAPAQGLQGVQGSSCPAPGPLLPPGLGVTTQAPGMVSGMSSHP